MAEKQKAGVERVLKGSFWLIAAIHITVFTVIGATTRQWRLLVIFLIGFVVVMVVYALFRLWQAGKNRSR
jgi:lipopolysaccharide export LptBFGC system permease protein LptF